jgi:hypothetical protein
MGRLREKLAKDNPTVAREIRLEDLKDHYEGAHYRDRRWYLFTEVNNYMNLDPTPSRGGADNIIGVCPRCQKPGLVRRSNWPLASAYVHISGKVDEKEVVILACPVQHERGGMIDASDIRF